MPKREVLRPKLIEEVGYMNGCSYHYVLNVTHMNNKLDDFCKDYIGRLEDMVDEIENDTDDLYLTDAEWDALHERVIDPLNKAVAYLEDLHGKQPDGIDELDY